MKSGSQLTSGFDGGKSILGLADDLITLELEQPARGGPEPRVVVDDEDGFSHTESLVSRTRFPQVVTL